MNGQSVAPGWYPDPSGSGGMRWWDGQVWHDQVAFAPGSEPRSSGAPAPRGVSPLVITGVAIAVVVLLIGAIVVANGSSGSSHGAAAGPGSARPSPAPTAPPVAIAPPLGDTGCGCTDATSAPTSVKVPVTAPPVTPTTPASAMPVNGESAIIAVDPPAATLTIETNLQDARYPVCAGFQAVSSTGGVLGLADLHAGDFAAVTVDVNKPCVTRVVVAAAPQPPGCSASGYGGGAEVTFVGSNATAHSVLYRPTGPNEPVLAGRWCQAPPVVGADGAAMSLAQVPSGATVELMLSNGDWVTSITVKQ